MASSKSWNCSACTFENAGGQQLCEMCGTNNPNAKSSGDSSGVGQWTCVSCTLKNDKLLIQCAVCNAPSPLVNDLSGKQICRQCTSINFANAVNCSVCDNALNSQVLQFDDQMNVLPQDNNNNNNNNKNNNYQPQQQPQQQPSYQPYQQYQFQQPLDPSFNSFQNIFNGSQPPQPPQPPQPQHNGFTNIFNGNSYNKKPKKKYSHKHKHKHKHGNNNNNNNNNKDNDGDIKFKDVTAIFKADENDQERHKKEAEEIKVLYGWYETIYFIKQKNHNIPTIKPILDSMMQFIPKEHFQEVEKLKKENENNEEQKKNENSTVCKVCYCEYDNDEGQRITMFKYCNHSLICQNCFKQHLKIKVKDDDITPWILCPSPNCKAPIDPILIIQYLSLSNLYKFVEEFIRKHLARNPNWIPCKKTKTCKFGFVIMDKDRNKEHKVRCKGCNKSDKVSKDPVKSDKGFNELIKNGVLRLCPKCSLPTMKDKGMCNIMHCGKCAIYWNWKTRETGTSSSQLKNRARSNGTLWEQGELHYQQQLQKNNPDEFKKLLQRNGIKYDPNYVRGTR